MIAQNRLYLRMSSSSPMKLLFVALANFSSWPRKEVRVQCNTRLCHLKSTLQNRIPITYNASCSFSWCAFLNRRTPHECNSWSTVSNRLYAPSSNVRHFSSHKNHWIIHFRKEINGSINKMPFQWPVNTVARTYRHLFCKQASSSKHLPV